MFNNGIIDQSSSMYIVDRTRTRDRIIYHKRKKKIKILSYLLQSLNLIVYMSFTKTLHMYWGHMIQSDNLYMDFVARKPVFGGLRTIQAQTSLHIRAV